MVKIEKEHRKAASMVPPPRWRHICMPGDNGVMERKFEELGLKRFDRVLQSDEEKVSTKIGSEVDFFIKEEAMDKIILHSYEMGLKGKEAMGFLIGDVRRWKHDYSIAFDAVTGSLDSTPYSVKFSRNAFEELFDKLDEIEYEYIIVGWYHSHVGYTSFMSNVDIETQRKYFNKPFHVAMVIDPINMEAKAFKLLNEQCIEIPYAIF